MIKWCKCGAPLNFSGKCPDCDASKPSVAKVTPAKSPAEEALTKPPSPIGTPSQPQTK